MDSNRIIVIYPSIIIYHLPIINVPPNTYTDLLGDFLGSRLRGELGLLGLLGPILSDALSELEVEEFELSEGFLVLLQLGLGQVVLGFEGQPLFVVLDPFRLNLKMEMLVYK